ncbi:hypothetical protein [Bradyrhizobium sp. Ce-3]|uniref:hypothetical protein n=1 Tax=Bradyrhizobium sp. Ce-3 TaxID=2913970 RepID=UPI001FC8497D|nr:hypothetical protein [Bradyrhizobium sp. Ce-3]GKQ52086.1 hypothetical protein BRSPCE3_29410 [Bradyrhizobium sp. Ce-3]
MLRAIRVAQHCGRPLQVSETILQKSEALENDLGSHSKVTSASCGRDRSAGRPMQAFMQAFMYVLETRVWI